MFKKIKKENEKMIAKILAQVAAVTALSVVVCKIMNHKDACCRANKEEKRKEAKNNLHLKETATSEEFSRAFGISEETVKKIADKYHIPLQSDNVKDITEGIGEYDIEEMNHAIATERVNDVYNPTEDRLYDYYIICGQYCALFFLLKKVYKWQNGKDVVSVGNWSAEKKMLKNGKVKVDIFLENLKVAELCGQVRETEDFCTLVEPEITYTVDTEMKNIFDYLCNEKKCFYEKTTIKGVTDES